VDVKGNEKEDCRRKHRTHFVGDSFSELVHAVTSATNDLTRTGLPAEMRKGVAQWRARDLNQPLERPVQLQDHERT